jgi:predicted nicotinamide N-methyase
MTLHGNALVADLKRRFITVNDDVLVGDRVINLIRPRSAEELISEADFERDERLPYWAELWPSSTILANFISNNNITAARGIELGCGIGLVSTAASFAGHTMLATDYYEEALQFTRANSYRNLGRAIETRLVDWRHLPDDLGTFELVLASDVLYESSYATLVSNVINKVLAPGGRAYIADPGRVAVSSFLDACEQVDLRVIEKLDRPYLAGEVRQTISVYELTRR